MPFELMEAETQDAIIKVIGVGGCGGNAVDHMIEQGVQGVEFIVINTDVQALNRSKARTQLQIGAAITKGLGAGAKPSVGQAAAEEDRERIREMLDGAHMVFITAGMGGGTGTGAAPVIAQIAKELDILTVAVVTKPFAYEGNRMRFAKAGIEALHEHVDSLIIVPNSKLMEVLGRDVTVPEAFKAANGVLQGAVAGIAEVINVPGLINVDFADVRTVMSENGMAMMGSAIASGADRARIAAERAIASPLLEDVDMTGARGVLVNITAAKSGLKLRETKEVMETIRSFAAEDATVILGAGVDWTTGKTMWITNWYNKGSVISAEGLLYIYEEKTGNLALVRPNSEKLDIISSFRVTKGDGPYWAHPVIDKGRLFVRHGDYMAAYSLKAK